MRFSLFATVPSIAHSLFQGYSSKCERCRHQQATRYANQKNKEVMSPGVPQEVPVIPAAAVDAAAAAAEAAAAAGEVANL